MEESRPAVSVRRRYDSAAVEVLIQHREKCWACKEGTSTDSDGGILDGFKKGDWRPRGQPINSILKIYFSLLLVFPLFFTFNFEPIFHYLDVNISARSMASGRLHPAVKFLCHYRACHSSRYPELVPDPQLVLHLNSNPPPLAPIKLAQYKCLQYCQCLLIYLRLSLIHI